MKANHLDTIFRLLRQEWRERRLPQAGASFERSVMADITCIARGEAATEGAEERQYRDVSFRLGISALAASLLLQFAYDVSGAEETLALQSMKKLDPFQILETLDG